MNRGLPVKWLMVLCVWVTLWSTGHSAIARQENVGIVLADDKGNVLFEQNRKKAYIPASTLKILTSLWAVETLGKRFRFPTQFSFDPGSKNLYIKGFGDPLMVSEVIEQFCLAVQAKTGVKQIHDIVLDGSYFSGTITVPGKGRSLNPYDAPVGALCANFNTIAFKWDAVTRRHVSAEPQTPLLPVFNQTIEETGLKQGRIVLSPQMSRLYPGQLIAHFFQKKGINVSGALRVGPFESTSGEPHVFLSPFTLDEVVFKLLKYSNNFIANQLLVSMGAQKYHAPGTIEKGTRALKAYFSQTLELNSLGIYEGAGLSKLNKITPEQMIRVLMNFMPYHSYLNQQANDYYKTGTLSGVRTRAGYIKSDTNRLFPYVIMVNQKGAGYTAILQRLLKLVRKVQ